MSQVTNLAFFRARRGQSEELGDDADLWFVYENWRSPEGFDAPMLSEHLKAFLKATPDLVAGNAPHLNATSISNSNRSTPMLFSGKNIIVTGATGDLGVAIVQRLISQGANVLAVAGHQSEISRLATCSGPGSLETSVADVSDAEQVLGYATRAFALWGQIDGFVNNAGIQTPVRPIVDFPEEDFDRVMAVNIRGVFLGMKYVLPRMREGGSVVNMSSALGLVGGAGICAYVASKHAIIGLTKTAALEQGPRGVRVNACCPGPIAGRMTFKLAEEVFAGSKKTFAETVPLGRHGTPEDVAGLVSYLLSDDSSYATGTAHSVDGGFTTA
jgi:NAD(P)-dependent dehydrogenase (short-subunit alcohol dehydrogenase family)/quinol monooxygenase YgiN